MRFKSTLLALPRQLCAAPSGLYMGMIQKVILSSLGAVAAEQTFDDFQADVIAERFVAMDPTLNPHPRSGPVPSFSTSRFLPSIVASGDVQFHESLCCAARQQQKAPAPPVRTSSNAESLLLEVGRHERSARVDAVLRSGPVPAARP